MQALQEAYHALYTGLRPAQFVLGRSERSTVSQLHPEISTIGRAPGGWTTYAPVAEESTP